MKHVVLFTGQIRDRARFATLLAAIESYRDTHHPTVLLSTWRDEVGRWPGLHAELAAAQVGVIAQEAPAPRERGHLLHQLLAIDAGLAMCDADDFVLKTRPDLGAENEIHAFFRSAPRAPTRGAWPSPFASRVAAGGFFGAQPFYIGDINFSGRAADLRKISAMPFAALASYSGVTGTEQMIWGPSFAALHPELAIYFRVNPGLIFNDPDRQARIREGLMASRLYHRALALGYLAKGASVRWTASSRDEAAVAAVCRTRTLEELLWSKDVIAGMRHHPGCATNFIVDGAILQALADGHYAASPFGTHVAEMLNHYRGGSERPSMETLLGEADALFEVAAGEPGLSGTARHLARTSDMANVTGALPKWLAEQGPGDTVHALETEMAGLRRVNDRLIDRLRALGEPARVTG